MPCQLLRLKPTLYLLCNCPDPFVPYFLLFSVVTLSTAHQQARGIKTASHSPVPTFLDVCEINKMASKLVPEDPAKVMVIRDVVPNTIITLSAPFSRFGAIKIGGRGTIGEPIIAAQSSKFHFG
jgi:hypothetical protein